MSTYKKNLFGQFFATDEVLFYFDFDMAPKLGPKIDYPKSGKAPKLFG